MYVSSWWGGGPQAAFSFACPKFLSPVAPAFDAPDAALQEGPMHKEPLRLQLKIFMDEVGDLIVL